MTVLFNSVNTQPKYQLRMVREKISQQRQFKGFMYTRLNIFHYHLFVTMKGTFSVVQLQICVYSIFYKFVFQLVFREGKTYMDTSQEELD